jgi:hypothetical protein
MTRNPLTWFDAPHRTVLSPHAGRGGASHARIARPLPIEPIPVPALPTKPCTLCGRIITWRKKWERDWDQVKFCSDACRRASKSNDQQTIARALEQSILALLAERPKSATICPSEAARRVRPDDWRDWMEPARQAARRLVEQGRVEITQSGRVVDPSTAKGPIRLRLSR